MIKYVYGLYSYGLHKYIFDAITTIEVEIGMGDEST